MRKRDRNAVRSRRRTVHSRECIPEVQFCEAATATTENNPADQTLADARRESQKGLKISQRKKKNFSFTFVTYRNGVLKTIELCGVVQFSFSSAKAYTYLSFSFFFSFFSLLTSTCNRLLSNNACNNGRYK
ncbi:hypothetical protein PUN28_009868 [Cardiocondyla obscurior]|uniref:Uncharacterized protein n=1 Tax=Cardiocondyla obscurior TaxID=286306 RepID=A0AAW2FMQ1_9HYME